MIRMDVRTVAEITGGHLMQNGASVEFHGISTDSRTLQPGELFIPLRGENFDGHDYLTQAIKRGGDGDGERRRCPAAPISRSAPRAGSPG